MSRDANGQPADSVSPQTGGLSHAQFAPQTDDGFAPGFCIEEETTGTHESSGAFAPTNKCACKKARCLRLYCSCFSRGQVCGERCGCVGCLNNSDHTDERSFVVHYTLKINQEAFTPSQALLVGPDEVINRKGCRCSKSRCQNNYCECFKMGAKCTALCKCEHCCAPTLDLQLEDKGGVLLKSRRKKFQLLIPSFKPPSADQLEKEQSISFVKLRRGTL